MPYPIEYNWCRWSYGRLG